MERLEGAESIDAYASKVRSLGETLNIGQPMMKAAFIQGLPRRYQALVFGDRGTFDAVVAYTSTLVASGLIKKSESVREVTENKVGTTTDHRQGATHVCYACGKTGTLPAMLSAQGTKNEKLQPRTNIKVPKKIIRRINRMQEQKQGAHRRRNSRHHSKYR